MRIGRAGEKTRVSHLLTETHFSTSIHQYALLFFGRVDGRITPAAPHRTVHAVFPHTDIQTDSLRRRVYPIVLSLIVDSVSFAIYFPILRSAIVSPHRYICFIMHLSYWRMDHISHPLTPHFSAEISTINTPALAITFWYSERYWASA